MRYMERILKSEELLATAEEAKTDLDKATTKDEIAAVFDHYAGSLGYKVVVRMLLGSSAASATAKWRRWMADGTARTEKNVD